MKTPPSQILSRLFLGAAPESVDDLNTLWDMGVTDIIDCRIEKPNDVELMATWARPRNVRLLSDGVSDWTPDAAIGKQPLGNLFFFRALNFWQPIVTPPVITYVHCSLGMNRSVTLVYFFLRVLGLSESDAIELINEHRIETLPWFDIMDSPWRGDAEAALKALGYA